MNSERWGSRAAACAPYGFGFAESSLRCASVHSRSAASHHSTTLHMSIEAFGDATASHKSAEGRSKHYEWCQLIVVEKREAVKRECARAEGVGSGERKARTAKQPQGPAREP